MAPLLTPSECTVLFVDPTEEHLAQLSETMQHQIAQNLGLVARAAAGVSVPLHVAFVGDIRDPERWPPGVRQLPAPQLHALPTEAPAWSRSGLAPTLAAQGRSSLILCGLWLETTITFIALPALASGFDVFIVLDATPPRFEHARFPAVHRLLHAGIVPTTSGQLVCEWIEASEDPNLRSCLALLSREREAGICDPY
jgi:hypothetical protein